MYKGKGRYLCLLHLIFASLLGLHYFSWQSFSYSWLAPLRMATPARLNTVQTRNHKIPAIAVSYLLISSFSLSHFPFTLFCTVVSRLCRYRYLYTQCVCFTSVSSLIFYDSYFLSSLSFLISQIN